MQVSDLGKHWVLVVSFLAFAAGCHEPSGGPGMKRDRKYLGEIKTHTLGFARNAEQNPATAKIGLEILQENLAESGGEDLGEHKATIEKLSSLAKEIQALYGRNAPAPEIKAKVKELRTAAESLPGEAAQGDAAQVRAKGDI